MELAVIEILSERFELIPGLEWLDALPRFPLFGDTESNLQAIRGRKLIENSIVQHTFAQK